MSSRARSSDDDLASRFDASARVRDGARGDAIERAFSVPKDFNQELESKSNVELRALMTDDDAFDALLASTTCVRESVAFVKELKAEISRACDDNEALAGEVRAAQTQRALLESTDLRRAEEAYELARENVSTRRANYPTLALAIDRARERARSLEESCRASAAALASTRGRVDRDDLDDFVRAYVEQKTTQHRLDLTADIAQE